MSGRLEVRVVRTGEVLWRGDSFIAAMRAGCRECSERGESVALVDTRGEEEDIVWAPCGAGEVAA